MNKALLIIGHGSRANTASLAFQRIVEDVRGKCNYAMVEGAHMESCSPTIEQAVEKIAARKMEEIIIVPYFLYEGIHLKQDIPVVIDKLKERYKCIKFLISGPIGYEPVMSDLVLKRAAEAC